MRPIRKATALAGTLAIFAAVAACSGPTITARNPPSSLSAAAVPATLSMPVSQPLVNGGGEAGFDFRGAQADAAQDTCDMFRQMVEGIDTLSSDQQQQLIVEMTDTVQYSQDPDLMRAVLDMSQGWTNDNPEQFVRGMRALSVICNVPYE
jgi:hypothetical protein